MNTLYEAQNFKNIIIVVILLITLLYCILKCTKNKIFV